MLEVSGFQDLLDSVGLSLDQALTGNGENMSRGQQEVVNAGRLLLRRSSLAVLDECLSHADLQHRKMLLEILRKELDRTVLVCITHDLATIPPGDDVWVLENGAVSKCCGAEVAFSCTDAIGHV